MENFYDMVVVMPLGPNFTIDYVIDNIHSIQHYTSCRYKIVLITEPNDTSAPELLRQFPDLDILASPRSYGKQGGLYVKVGYAYKHVVENYRFDALLRLDLDAMIIGKDPEKEAIRMFKDNPKIGIAGQYPNAYTGKIWDNSWGRKETLKAVTWQLPRRPRGNWEVLKLYVKALKHNFVAGDFVFGGVCFLSEPLLITMYEEGYLPNKNLGKCFLEEDHIESLIAKAYGFEFGDLGSGSLPFACDWLGMPASPEQLYKDGKKIIHSTRSWKDMKEPQIREYFRKKREEVKTASQLV